MALSLKQKEKYIIKKGWYTFRSPSNWLNDQILCDMSLDYCGLSLIQAFDMQIKYENKKL